MGKYFIDRGSNCFLTENNWKDYYESKLKDFDSSAYQLEENEDIKAQIRITKKFASKGQAKLFLSELKKIRKLLKNEYPTAVIERNGYGDEYEILATSVIFEIPYKIVIDRYHCFGENDGKVDTFFVDESNETIYLCQIKTGSDIESDISSLMKETFSNFIENGSSNGNEDFTAKIKKTYTPDRLKTFGCKTIVVCEKRPNGVDSYYNMQDIIEKFINKNLLPRTSINIKLSIKKTKSENALLKSDDNKQSFFFCNGHNLIESIILELGDEYHEIFYENVRGELSSNNEIRETINKNPEKFMMFNNGISIICDGWQENATYIAVNKPSIVNGQQTVITLLNKYKEEKNALKKIVVPVFLKTVEERAYISEIAKFNNSQKAVKPLDMLSLYKNIRAIQEALLNVKTEQYYLDIYSTGKVPRRDNILKSVDVKRVRVKDFVRLYFSIKEPEDIGFWKNSFSKALEESSCKDEDFDLETSFAVCNTIIEFEEYKKLSKKNKKVFGELGAYDLPFMYFMYKNGNDIEDAKKSIECVITKNEGTPIPDIFRRRNIYQEMKEC